MADFYVSKRSPSFWNVVLADDSVRQIEAATAEDAAICAKDLVLGSYSMEIEEVNGFMFEGEKVRRVRFVVHTSPVFSEPD